MPEPIRSLGEPRREIGRRKMAMIATEFISNGVESSCRLSFVAESVKDFVDVLETLDEFRYLSGC
jgi:hypothetical protein